MTSTKDSNAAFHHHSYTMDNMLQSSAQSPTKGFQHQIWDSHLITKSIFCTLKCFFAVLTKMLFLVGVLGGKVHTSGTNQSYSMSLAQHDLTQSYKPFKTILLKREVMS